MGYVQMTIDDWLDIKNRIRKELNNVKHSFVRAGYYLRKVRDEELYLQDGFKSLTDWAKAEYNLGPSVVSRLISINEKYSVDGYSQTLLPEYEDFRQGALTEMLALPDTDMEMVTPKTSREDIRELKRFNAQDPPQGDAQDRSKLLEAIEDFCRQNRELINDLYANTALASTAEKDLIEMINPSGSRVFKSRLYFISFMESAVKIKKFMKPPENMSYQDFAGLIVEVMGSEQDGHIWEKHFGEKTEDPAESQKKDEEKADEAGKENRAAAKKHDQGNGYADPAGKPDRKPDRGNGEPGEAKRGNNKRDDGAGQEGAGQEPGADTGQRGPDAKPDPEPEEAAEETGSEGAGETASPERDGEEAQEETGGVAPAQLFEGMNPPEEGEPEEESVSDKRYDMEKIAAIFTSLEESVREERWLSAERLAYELAACLEAARKKEVPCL